MVVDSDVGGTSGWEPVVGVSLSFEVELELPAPEGVVQAANSITITSTSPTFFIPGQGRRDAVSGT